MMSKNKLPKIVILYGPAGSGKGTQAKILKEKLEGYYHLDFGTELRKFVKENIDSSNNEVREIATSCKNNMDQGLPVETPHLRFIVEKTIIDNVATGNGMLIEGPGRKTEESQWLSKFFRDNNMDSCIFHLHLNLDTILGRLKTRWYIPSNPAPFKSFEDAKNEAKDGEEPYQREDDVSIDSVKQRYRVMYSDIFGKILKIYMINSHTDILPIDADQPVDEVHKDIMDIMTGRYGFVG